MPSDADIRRIQPAKASQNVRVKRSDRAYREGVLDLHLFTELRQVQEFTYRWTQSYNEAQPHDAVGGVPQSVFRQRLGEAGLPTLA